MFIALPLPLPLPVQACNGIASLVMKIMNNLNLPSAELVPGLDKCRLKYQIFNRASHYCCNQFVIFTTVLQSAFNFLYTALSTENWAAERSMCIRDVVQSTARHPVLQRNYLY
jgi:hypothetical protein